MRARDLLLVGTICAGSALVVKAAQVSLTPEFWDWLAVASDRLLASSGVGVLLLVTTVLFLGEVAAQAWDVANRSACERADERARRDAGLPRRMAKGPSSFLDGTPRGSLPGTFRAPCGELVRLPETKSDSGPWAMGDVA